MHDTTATPDTSSAPPITLPSHWRTPQRLKNTFIYFTLRALYAAIARLPLASLAPIATTLGTAAYALARRTRHDTLTHLARAMPELSARDTRRIARQTFVHLARNALESTHADAFLQHKLCVLTAENRAVLDDAFSDGRGVISITGHIGNWELLAQTIACAGYPIATIAKPTYDPRLTAWVHAMRTQHGLNVIWRGKGNEATRPMLRALHNKHLLAMLVDQHTRVPNITVPFFNIPAETPRAPATLAVRLGTPIVIGWAHRTRGNQHTIHLECYRPTLTGDTERDVATITAHASQRLEAAIRQHPEQWVWMHKRWRA